EKGTIDLPEAKIFRTGANQWESYDQWPPDTIIRRNLYLQADGHLSFQAPTESGNEAKDDYISDPANPVPYRNRPIKYAGWAEWQLEDQRLANGRPDVLTYISEDLTGDITITGDPVAHLFAATTGTAADWVVKLIDVYPQEYEAEPYMGGFQFMVAGEVFRARYRNSFWEPEPLIEGEITPYEISLRDRHHTFRKGHRIMVQVQSTWFPLIDRNPQSYVDNIYKAEEGDFISTTHSVFRNETFPSHISLPVDTSK
ncbi:MAG: CocE/NonD family hydrolase, partial [Lacipirellulaceae bacterium]